MRWNGLDARDYPNLVRLGLAGHIFVDKNTGPAQIIGIASDDAEVRLGNWETLDETERYLESYPNPKDW